MRRLLAAFTLCLALLFSVVVLPVAGQQGTTTQRDQQTQTVYVTRTGKKYHRDGCRYLVEQNAHQFEGGQGEGVHGLQGVSPV